MISQELSIELGYGLFVVFTIMLVPAMQLSCWKQLGDNSLTQHIDQIYHYRQTITVCILNPQNFFLPALTFLSSFLSASLGRIRCCKYMY